MVIRESQLPGRWSAKLVLADPRRLVIESLATALSRRGIHVAAVATSPREALSKVAEQQPDVCLLSASFPSCSGLAVLQEMGKRHPDVGVVMLSAGPDPGLMSEAFRCGAAAVIPTNCRIDDIERTLARVAERKQAAGDGQAGTAVRSLRRPGAGSGHGRGGSFTSREKEILTHIGEGECTQQIARSLGITEATVRTHVQNVLSKLGVHSRLEATIVAAQTGVLDHHRQGAFTGRAAGGR
jgi:two-component system nitrate/nitrite response regulator NarL